MMGNIADKLNKVMETKESLKTAINSELNSQYKDYEEVGEIFSEYPTTLNQWHKDTHDLLDSILCEKNTF